MFDLAIHRAFIALSQKFGYTNTDNGLCKGYSVRRLESNLLGTAARDRFEARRKLIIGRPAQQIEGMIKDSKTKKNMGLVLNEEDDLLLELPAFYHSVQIFQKDHFHIYEIEELSNLGSSQEILAKGGLKKVYNECLFYNKSELMDYFQKLTLLLETVPSPDEIPFLLINKKHAISLCYHPGQGWTGDDINQVPIDSPIIDLEIIANLILEGYSRYGLPVFTYVAFNIALLLTSQDPRILTLQKILTPFKDNHEPSEVIANREQINGESLITIAAIHNDIAVLKILASYKVDLDTLDEEGSTPAQIASSRGYLEFVQELAKNGVVLSKNVKNDVTPGYLAAQNNHVSIVKWMLTIKVDLTIPYNNRTSLFVAAQWGHTEIVNTLLESKMSPSEGRNPSKTLTAIQIAVISGHSDVVRVLLKYKASVSDPGSCVNETPLILAISANWPEIVGILADNGADLNQVRRDGSCPIHHAILLDRLEIIKVLIKRGCNFNTLYGGATPRALASALQKVDIVNYFHLADRKQQLIRTIKVIAEDSEHDEGLYRESCLDLEIALKQAKVSEYTKKWLNGLYQHIKIMKITGTSKDLVILIQVLLKTSLLLSQKDIKKNRTIYIGFALNIHQYSYSFRLLSLFMLKLTIISEKVFSNKSNGQIYKILCKKNMFNELSEQKEFFARSHQCSRTAFREQANQKLEEVNFHFGK